MLCVNLKVLNHTVLYYGNCLSISGSKDQHAKSYCKKEEALAVKPIEGSQNDSDMRLGFILGIIGGSVGLPMVLALIILLSLRMTKTERADNYLDRSVADKSPIHASPRPNTDTSKLPFWILFFLL